MLKIVKYAKTAKSLTANAPKRGVRFIQVTGVYKKNTVVDANVSDTLTQMNEWMECGNIGECIFGYKSTHCRCTGASLTAIKLPTYVEGKIVKTINDEDEDDRISGTINSREDD